MKTILKIIVWGAYGVYGIIFLHNKALEIGLPAFLFGIPALVIVGAAIYAILNEIDKKKR